MLRHGAMLRFFIAGLLGSEEQAKDVIKHLS
jgi:hypothetical protein